MADEEWMADPQQLVLELRGVPRRKFRLFCCAYCRAFFWCHLTPEVQAAVATAEAYADETASQNQLRQARTAFGTETATDTQWRATLAADVATFPTAPHRSAVLLLDHRNTRPRRGGRKAIARLLGCIFGSIFRPVLANPAWRTSTVMSLARGIYAEKAFGRLPILADALQDAGCEDTSILGHCRGEGPHVRGCWVVDAVLGKS
jgi:hypothetical protein